MGLIGGDEITIRKQQVKRIKNFKLLKISCSEILRTNCYKCLFENDNKAYRLLYTKLQKIKTLFKKKVHVKNINKQNAYIKNKQHHTLIKRMML